MALFTSFNLFQLFIAFSVMPLVFIFLWCLIIGDFKVKLNPKFTSNTYSINFFRISKTAAKVIQSLLQRIQLTVIKTM